MALARRPRRTDSRGMTPPPSRRRFAACRPLVRAAQKLWPLYAGALTAFGLVGSVGHYGLVGAVLIYLGSAMFGMVMVFAAFAESGVDGVRVVRIGLLSALALVALLGVIVLLPIAGWFLAAAAAATCPLVTSRLTDLEPGATRDVGTAVGPGVGPGVDAAAAAAEQARVDRIFERMVSDLKGDEAREPEGS
jgi:hypothetical protein